MRRRLFRHEQKVFARVVDAGRIYASDAPKSEEAIPYAVRAHDFSAGSAALELAGDTFGTHYSVHPSHIETVVDGFYYRFALMPFQGHGKSAAGQLELRAEIPGRIVKIIARSGADVEAGEILLIQEAMKMEMSLAAPARFRVKEILVQEGAQVEADAVLVRFESREG